MKSADAARALSLGGKASAGAAAGAGWPRNALSGRRIHLRLNLLHVLHIVWAVDPRARDRCQ